MPDWLYPFLALQLLGFAGWCIRVELRLAELKGKTEGIAGLAASINAIQVTLGVMGNDIKSLYRLVDMKSHE